MLTEHTQEVALQVGHKAVKSLVYVISQFTNFAGYAEQTSPDIDVPKFPPSQAPRRLDEEQ
jgi:hypothetical protein